MKIAMITDNFLPDFIGGAEVNCFRLSKALVKEGHDVHIIKRKHLFREGVQYDSDFRVHQVRYFPIIFRTFFPFDPLVFHQVCNILTTEKFDIAVIQNIEFLSTSIILALKRYGIPMVWHINDFYSICPVGLLPYNAKEKRVCTPSAKCCFCTHDHMRTILSPIRQFFFKLAYNSVTFVIVPSDSVKQVLIDYGFQHKKINVIPYCVPKGHFYPESKDKVRHLFGLSNKDKVALFISRLEKSKGLEVLLDATPQIISRIKNYKLLIVGTGPLNEKIRRLILSNMDLQAHIVFIGALPPAQTKLVYQASDVVVAPFICDSVFGIILIEAMMCSRPVITTNIGGQKELVINGVNGYLVEPENTVQLAEKIASVLSDDALRKELGDSALKFSESYNVENYVHNVLKVYIKVNNDSYWKRES